MEFGKAQKSPQHQTVIIFDWDDTLLCTSFLNLRNQAGETKTHRTIQRICLFLFISFFIHFFQSFFFFRSRCSPQPSSGISGSKSELGVVKKPPGRSAALASKDIEAASKKLLELAKRMVRKAEDVTDWMIFSWVVFFHIFRYFLKFNSFQSSH